VGVMKGEGVAEKTSGGRMWTPFVRICVWRAFVVLARVYLVLAASSSSSGSSSSSSGSSSSSSSSSAAAAAVAASSERGKDVDSLCSHMCVARLCCTRSRLSRTRLRLTRTGSKQQKQQSQQEAVEAAVAAVAAAAAAATARTSTSTGLRTVAEVSITPHTLRTPLPPLRTPSRSPLPLITDVWGALVLCSLAFMARSSCPPSSFSSVSSFSS